MSNMDNVVSDSMDVSSEFKKPMLVKKLSKKVPQVVDKPESSAESDKNENSESVLQSSNEIPYKVPIWSNLCPEGTNYALEVLKSGMILETIELTNKPYYVFGRLSNCEVTMAHPTISRYHAVLQYKSLDDDEQPAGWYIYDLGSTHGTFLNRQQIKEKHYVRVRVGHQIKFGLSSRIYIVLGPDFDAEGESSLSVTEIKQRAAQMALERKGMLDSAEHGDDKLDENRRKEEERRKGIEEIRQREEARQKEELIRKEKEKKREEEGIDWGMGDDSEEEPDLADNPYASTANEELYLQDPKKTLRGFFSREGIELEYDCVEKGVGQFSCSVELPIDDAQGRPVIAEVIHRGKKKDAVVACALEACRILDRVGLLRQAKHESRRRKERDWSADDYYDSDEDTFFDRTGNVEKKRNTRMEKLGVVTTQSNKPPDYYELVEKIKELESNIVKEEKLIESMREEMKQNAQYKENLDDYMETIDAIPNYHQTSEHKQMISKSKLKIKQMQYKLSETRRLAEVARPTQLPQFTNNKVPAIQMKKTNSVLYGKRIRLKDDLIKKPSINKVNSAIKPDTEEFVEEVDSDEEICPTSSTEKSPNVETRLSANSEVSNDETRPSNMKTNDNKKASQLEVSKASIDEMEHITMKVSKEEKRPSNTANQEKSNISKQKQLKNSIGAEKKIYGPMRPPANYVIPDNYYDQESDRDLPEITEKPESS